MGGFFDYILGEGTTNIGREDPSSGWFPQIAINSDKSVSRRHCRIVKEGEEYFIEDQESKHGTRLNGEEIKGQGRKDLKDQDKISLGDETEIIFYMSSEGSD